MGYTNVNHTEEDKAYQFQFHDKQYDWINGSNGIPDTLQCSMSIYKKLVSDEVEDDYILLKYEVINIPSKFFSFKKRDLECEEGEEEYVSHIMYEAKFKIKRFIKQLTTNDKTMIYIVSFGNCYLITSDKWVEVTQIRENAKKFKS